MHLIRIIHYSRRSSHWFQISFCFCGHTIKFYKLVIYFINALFLTDSKIPEIIQPFSEICFITKKVFQKVLKLKKVLFFVQTNDLLMFFFRYVPIDNYRYISDINVLHSIHCKLISLHVFIECLVLRFC